MNPQTTIELARSENRVRESRRSAAASAPARRSSSAVRASVGTAPHRLPVAVAVGTPG